MRVKKGKIEYEFIGGKPSVRIYYNGIPLNDYVTTILNTAPIVIADPFDQSTKQITIPRSVNNICNDVFDAIKIVKLTDKDEELAAYLAARLFESFTPYWRVNLLNEAKDMLGIYFWKEVLKLTRDWEAINSVKIHTGTPNFFLSENYFLVGDRDLAFVYLYDALEDDKILNVLAPVFNYPHTAPASYTATMHPDTANKMFYIVKEMRDRLSSYIVKFNAAYNGKFTIGDFDAKFRLNTALGDVVSFFVYNFLYLLIIEKNTKPRSLNNDFSRLRSLDLFFNFCLVIDETLKVLYTIKKGKITGEHYISNSILWLCDDKKWISESELQDFWGKKFLKLNGSEPDVIVPRLLMANEVWNGRLVPKEVFPLLVAYKFRNYGGHSIAQQQVITKEYAKILDQLIFALFIAINEM